MKPIRDEEPVDLREITAGHTPLASVDGLGSRSIPVLHWIDSLQGLADYVRFQRDAEQCPGAIVLVGDVPADVLGALPNRTDQVYRWDCTEHALAAADRSLKIIPVNDAQMAELVRRSRRQRVW